jgi:hypothetical protein
LVEIRSRSNYAYLFLHFNLEMIFSLQTCSRLPVITAFSINCGSFEQKLFSTKKLFTKLEKQAKKKFKSLSVDNNNANEISYQLYYVYASLSMGKSLKNLFFIDTELCSDLNKFIFRVCMIRTLEIAIKFFFFSQTRSRHENIS